jgi:hypothetical protein
VCFSAAAATATTNTTIPTTNTTTIYNITIHITPTRLTTNYIYAYNAYSTYTIRIQQS